MGKTAKQLIEMFKKGDNNMWPSEKQLKWLLNVAEQERRLITTKKNIYVVLHGWDYWKFPKNSPHGTRMVQGIFDTGQDAGKRKEFHFQDYEQKVHTGSEITLSIPRF